MDDGERRSAGWRQRIDIGIFIRQRRQQRSAAMAVAARPCLCTLADRMRSPGASVWRGMAAQYFRHRQTLAAGVVRAVVDAGSVALLRQTSKSMAHVKRGAPAHRAQTSSSGTLRYSLQRQGVERQRKHQLARKRQRRRALGTPATTRKRRRSAAAPRCSRRGVPSGAPWLHIFPLINIAVRLVRCAASHHLSAVR